MKDPKEMIVVDPEELIPGFDRDDFEEKLADGLAKGLGGKVITYGNPRLDKKRGIEGFDKRLIDDP